MRISGLYGESIHFPYLQCMQSESLYHRLWERIFPGKWVLGLSLVLQGDEAVMGYLGIQD